MTALEHSDREQQAKKLAELVYTLQAASFLVGVTFVVAAVVNYVKRDAVAGTWVESHFRWQLRTFWIGLVLTVLGLLTFIVLIGIPILIGNSIWIIYRITKGWLYLRDGKPMYR